MNLIYKLYCRTFQRVLWLALPLLPYRDPETLDSVRQLPEVLRSRGVDRILLVTDRQLRSRGLTAPLEALLPQAGIGCTVYDGTASNPTVDNVEEARELYLRGAARHWWPSAAGPPSTAPRPWAPGWPGPGRPCGGWRAF